MLATKHRIGNQDTVLLAKNDYNEIGQLKTKELHWNSATGKFLNTIAHKYNTRGWLKESRGENFIQVLRYDSLDAGYTKQYNGNISRQYWRYTPTEAARMTVYSYDKLNRLKLATSTGVTLSEELTYDDMGNIRTLKRDGTATYSYNNSNKSNRLLNLTGGINGGYTYDENGNAKTDRMGISFTYNHLNLPQTASRAASANVTAVAVNYLYDAMGGKLRKTATVSGTTTVRDYIGGIEYAKTGTGASVIERIATEEGYLQNNNGIYLHHYNLTDHLGNVRSVIRAEGSGVAVIQQQDYYAFGKTKSIVTGGINRYLYNGKEVQAEIGDQLDYGARFYDAEIGRWNVVDPLADFYSIFSPYNYVLNNPINYVNPNGMSVEDYLSAKTSTYIDRNGKIIDHRDDGDPRVYLVGNPSSWDGKKDGLAVIGYEDPNVEYKIGDTYKYYYNPQINKDNDDDEIVGAAFRGGKKNNRDKNMRHYPVEFKRWFHKYYKGKTDDDRTYKELEESYQEWLDMGKPQVKIESISLQDNVRVNNPNLMNQPLKQNIKPVAQGIGIGVILYWTISKVSRLFPLRNLVPIP